MTHKLTARIIDAEPVPTKGGRTLWDSEVRGLGVRINAGGAKSFFLNYRIDGIERRKTIGRVGEWSVEAARSEAKELRRQVDRGQDPAADKRERREAPTIQDLIDRYIADHLPKKTAGEGRARAEKKMLAEIGKQLGTSEKVADIHGGDIKAMHEALTKSGIRGRPRPVGANRILSAASKMFALSLVPMAGENEPWRNAADGNPCRGIERNREEASGLLFTQAELAAISDALADYGADARGPGIASAKSAADCIRLITLTGCRPSEARLARWEEFEKEPRYWVKPSAHTKQRREHRLPLAPPAIELIERLRKQRKPGATWIFEGQRPGEPLKQLWSVWGFVRDRAGLGDDARIYDLRHTFASLGAGGGLSLPILGRLLGHTQNRTTERYSRHLADDPVRAAAEKVAAMISGARPSADNVVTLGKAQS
jgi:integrase